MPQRDIVKIYEAVTVKDPVAITDIGFDYQGCGWLPTGDTISASQWFVHDDSKLVIDGADFTTTTTTVRVSANEAGNAEELWNIIQTAGGLQDKRTWLVTCRNR